MLCKLSEILVCLLLLQLSAAIVKGIEEAFDHLHDGGIAYAGEFPGIVQLNVRTAKGTILCGGTLIDASHVVTAAHCVHNIPSKDVRNFI